MMVRKEGLLVEMKTRLMVCLAQLLVDVVGSLSYELTLNELSRLQIYLAAACCSELETHVPVT